MRAIVFFSLIALCPHLPGQGFTLLFSTDGTEVAANGTGGSSTALGNATAVFSDEAVLGVTPGVGASAAAVVGREFWMTWFGDGDSDGDYTGGNIGNLDALHAPAGTANPPSIFDLFVSFSRDVGPGGLLGATIIRDGDMVRIDPTGNVTAFITEAQIAVAMGTLDDIDVNGFAVDPNTGDLYWTLTTTHSVSGVPVDDGGLIRLPASGYVANANGTVASVIAGSAVIAMTESDVDALFANAGLPGVADLDGVALDPAGGTFTSPSGTTLPHFWFAPDSNVVEPMILSTQGGGSVAQINGLGLDDSPAFGLGATDYNGNDNSSVTALSWTSNNLGPVLPRLLGSNTAEVASPSTLTLDAGGFTPGNPLIIVARFGATNTGGFTSRLDVQGTALIVPGGVSNLFITDPFDPVVLFTRFDPPLTIDPMGQASKSWAIPGGLTGNNIVLVAQSLDLVAMSLSAPTTVVIR